MLPAFLLDPDVRARISKARELERQAELEHFEKVLVPKTRAWDPMGEKPRKDVCYSAESFIHQIHYPFSLRECPPTSPKEDVGPDAKVCDYASEANTKYPVQWLYRNNVLPRGTGLDAYPTRKGTSVRVYFDADVPIPVLFRFRPWLAKTSDMRMRVWMSMVPMEYFTLRPGVRKATRKVMIAGLGLGLNLRMIAQKRTVRHIVVVERSQELLDWFGYDLASDIEDETETHIEVVCADAYKHLEEVGAKSYTRLIFDIWDTWTGARWDQEFQELYLKHKDKIWFWGARMLPDVRR